MARPYWSGPIQISLVSFGVSLYVATESKSRISFHQISRSTGERVRHQKVLESSVDAEEAAVVQKDEIVKGYEYRKGQYVIIEPSELENLRVPSKHTIEVSQFVDVDENGSLSGGDVLPGFELSLPELFALADARPEDVGQGD